MHFFFLMTSSKKVCIIYALYKCNSRRCDPQEADEVINMGVAHFYGTFSARFRHGRDVPLDMDKWQVCWGSRLGKSGVGYSTFTSAKFLRI